MQIFLFIFGAIIGSFINVLALRYKEDGRILFTRQIQGRSHCPHCNRTLTWFELVPILSFIFLAGRCRTCKTRLSPQYIFIELASALLTAYLPYTLFTHLGGSFIMRTPDGVLLMNLVIIIWLLISYTALTLTAIDIRLKIIPDECNIFLTILGVGLITTRFFLDATHAYGPFSGPYSEILTFSNGMLTSVGIGALIGFIFFGGIVFLTRGRGMGMGDVKLAIPLGLILGWPDALIAFCGAFIIGAVVGMIQMLRHRATMKAMLPFGPFLIAGMYVSVFFSEPLLRWYFGLI